MESELIDNLQDNMNPDLLKKYVAEYLLNTTVHANDIV